MEQEVKTQAELFTFCQMFPKIDLHAHLNGSIRKSTLMELSSETNRDLLADLYSKIMNYRIAFEIFKISAQILTNLATVSRITKEMIEDWQKQNCIYLEIRTSLKNIEDKGKSEYLKTVLQAIYEGNQKYKMQTRLIISLNREYSIEEYLETFEVLKQFNANNANLSKLIVGIDYAGNETQEKHEIKDIAKIFNKFKEEFGYKLTYHIAETKNYKPIDFENDFKPNRLSHCHFLTSEDQKQLIKNKIPLEVCPTSSYYCKEVYSYKDINLCDYHNKTHFFEESNENYKYEAFCINTDDTMLFNTDLSQEYYEVAINFNINKKGLANIVLNTVEFIFESDEVVKQELRKEIKKWN